MENKNRDYFVKSISRGHHLYWNMLGNMRGNERHEDCGLQWLSGDIWYTYAVNFNSSGCEKQIIEIIEKIKNKQVPDNLFLTPINAPADEHALALLNSDFSEERTCYGMAKKIQSDTIIAQPPKSINLFRVHEMNQLKATGAILNAAFEYDLFSFEHYLDAFNSPGVRFYLAEYNGIPAGACMSIYGDDLVEIAWAGTLSGYRKKGIAGYLISMAEKDAADIGKNVSVLSALPGAVNAYSRIGYETYYEIKILKYKFNNDEC